MTMITYSQEQIMELIRQDLRTTHCLDLVEGNYDILYSMDDGSITITMDSSQTETPQIETPAPNEISADTDTPFNPLVQAIENLEREYIPVEKHIVSTRTRFNREDIPAGFLGEIAVPTDVLILMNWASLNKQMVKIVYIRADQTRTARVITPYEIVGGRTIHSILHVTLSESEVLTFADPYNNCRQFLLNRIERAELLEV